MGYSAICRTRQRDSVVTSLSTIEINSLSKSMALFSYGALADGSHVASSFSLHLGQLPSESKAKIHLTSMQISSSPVWCHPQQQFPQQSSAFRPASAASLMAAPLLSTLLHQHKAARPLQVSHPGGSAHRAQNPLPSPLSVHREGGKL